MAQDILRNDPILSSLKQYLRARENYLKTNAEIFTNTLNLAAKATPEAAKFCKVLKSVLKDLSEPEYSSLNDPYYSSVISSWIKGLQRGLEWILIGADVECLSFFSNTSDFFKDLSLEYPSYVKCKHTHFYATIDNVINLIPAQFLYESPRMNARVLECLPEISSQSFLTKVDRDILGRIKDHIEKALFLLNKLFPEKYKIFKMNIHSIYVGLYESSKNSFGTHGEYPGTIIMGISRDRLDQNDIISTAAELFHEHCHLKLCLFFHYKKISLPKDKNLVSPFTNETRDFTTVLHTVYTLSIESHIRLSLLHTQNNDEQIKASCILAAIGFRLELLKEILANHQAMLVCKEFQKVILLTGAVLNNVFSLMTSSSKPLLKAFQQEKQRVIKRHIWDIGQFLSRGVPIRDPYLSVVTRNKNKVNYLYRDKEYTSTPRKKRITNGDFGSFAEKFLKT